MQNKELENVNQTIFNRKNEININRLNDEKNDELNDEIDVDEIYDIIKNINDPEHPLTLQQLNVVSKRLIKIKENIIKVYFCPTIPNCSMSTLIGLLIKIKLLLCLPKKYKIDIYIEPGKHYLEDSINKQLHDKERVFAAFENDNVKKLIKKGVENGIDFAISFWVKAQITQSDTVATSNVIMSKRGKKSIVNNTTMQVEDVFAGGGNPFHIRIQNR